MREIDGTNLKMEDTVNFVHDKTAVYKIVAVTYYADGCTLVCLDNKTGAYQWVLPEKVEKLCATS